MGSRHVTHWKQGLSSYMLTHKMRITQNDLTCPIASSQEPQLKEKVNKKVLEVMPVQQSSD